MAKDNFEVVFSDKEIAEYQSRAKTMGEDLIQAIMAETSKIRSRTTGEAFLHHFDPVIVERRMSNTGSVSSLTFSVYIDFDRIAMHRESLYPKGYPNGIQVDALFSNGYSFTKKRLYGKDRHGRKIKSKRSRRPNDFMARAFRVFRAKYPDEGIDVQYSNRFRGGTYPSGWVY